MLRRPMVGRGRPSLLGTMARTAVVAGTASATVGAVNRHSQSKAQAAADEQAQQQPAQQQPATQPAPAATDPIAGLKQLADLKAAGALTDAEFAAAKAKLLGL
jgi:membrane protease subunit (stomatin/prohibitin family)